MEQAEAYRPYIEWAFRQPGLNGRQISYRGASEELNRRNIESPMGRRWSGHQLARTARRLGLQHPPGYMKNHVVRARVHELWSQNPSCTRDQVVANIGLEHGIGLVRAGAHLRAVRQAAAKRSRAQKRVGWRIDRFTALRIRIGELLKRQPKLLGREVIEKLGLGHSVRIQWVWYVMQQYRRGSAQPTRD
jgi:hypothetical protein